MEVPESTSQAKDSSKAERSDVEAKKVDDVETFSVLPSTTVDINCLIKTAICYAISKTRQVSMVSSNKSEIWKLKLKCKYCKIFENLLE